MGNIVYVGLKDVERNKAIAHELDSLGLQAACKKFHLSASGVYKAARKVRATTTFEMQLIRAGERVPIATVAYNGTFLQAAKSTMNHFSGLFTSLQLHDWRISDGTTSVAVAVLREKD